MIDCFACFFYGLVGVLYLVTICVLGSLRGVDVGFGLMGW